MDTKASGGFIEKYMTPIAVVVGALIIGGALYFGHGQKAPAPAGQQQPPAVAVDIKNIKTAGDPIVGDKNAPVTIAIWFDYQCPFCKQLDLNTLPQVYDTYVKAGKVKLVYKDFQFLGPDSDTDALYARAVLDAYPDKWYGWFTMMMQKQDGERTGFGDLASVTAATKALGGIDTDKIAKLMVDNKAKYEAAIKADYDEGGSFGVNGTPAVVIGTTMLGGAQPFSALQPLIDAELKK